MFMNDEDKRRYCHCRDCIFFDVYADGQVTEYLCHRKQLEDGDEYRDLSSDISAYNSCVVPCAFKVSIGLVLEIIKERMQLIG